VKKTKKQIAAEKRVLFIICKHMSDKYNFCLEYEEAECFLFTIECYLKGKTKKSMNDNYLTLISDKPDHQRVNSLELLIKIVLLRTWITGKNGRLLADIKTQNIFSPEIQREEIALLRKQNPGCFSIPSVCLVTAWHSIGSNGCYEKDAHQDCSADLSDKAIQSIIRDDQKSKTIVIVKKRRKIVIPESI